jgi:hypothetical protein
VLHGRVDRPRDGVARREQPGTEGEREHRASDGAATSGSHGSIVLPRTAGAQSEPVTIRLANTVVIVAAYVILAILLTRERAWRAGCAHPGGRAATKE